MVRMMDRWRDMTRRKRREYRSDCTLRGWAMLRGWRREKAQHATGRGTWEIKAEGQPDVSRRGEPERGGVCEVRLGLVLVYSVDSWVGESSPTVQPSPTRCWLLAVAGYFACDVRL